MEPVRFAIVGGGWRSRFYLQAARELPERFHVTGLLTRDRATAAALERDWAISTPVSLDDLLAEKPAFVVVSVPWAVTPSLLRELAGRRVPVLSETPPAPEIDGLARLKDLGTGEARIQVAEQYQFQPLHAARLAVVAAGWLGSVSQAQVSIAHGYHGIDLMRRFLGIGFEPVTVSARAFRSPLIAGPNRAGPPAEERLVESVQVIATFDFDATELGPPRLGIFDFTEDQYFAWIRAPRLLVRGERGEIVDSTVHRLLDARTPITLELERRDAGHDGDLQGFHHQGITAGETWLYRNPFVPGRLSDDEIAVATCLQRMAEYVEGGPAFCALDEAVHDHYLAILLQRAVDEGRPIRSEGHLWRRDAAR